MSSLPRAFKALAPTHPEPTISCPHCHVEFKLTESLAAPLLRIREAEFQRRDDEIRQREKELRGQAEAVGLVVERRLGLERKQLAAEASKKARAVVGLEMEAKDQELVDLRDLLHVREAKLTEAQQAHAETVRKQRELEERERELELTVEKRVKANLGESQRKARQEAADEYRLQVAEKEQVITSMQGKIDDLRRKSEQGSQQTRGDVMEADLLQHLMEHCRPDDIVRVPKGEFGGDVLHRVMSSGGKVCGAILWESKRTKAWSDGWLGKLRADQRAARADVAVIVSQTLPKGVTHFDLIEGVYVASPACAMALALLLRQGLIELSTARHAIHGRETKEALVYEYLTGPRFRQRVQAIVEAFSIMQDDLNTEKRVMQKQWAKRETQLDRLVQSTGGLYGDLQGIAGQHLEGLAGLDMRELDAPDLS